MDTTDGMCEFHSSMLKELQNVMQSIQYDLVAIDNQINQSLPVVQPPPGITTPLYQAVPGFIYSATRPDPPVHSAPIMELIGNQLNHLQQLMFFISHKLASLNNKSVKQNTTPISQMNNISVVTGNNTFYPTPVIGNQSSGPSSVLLQQLNISNNYHQIPVQVNQHYQVRYPQNTNNYQQIPQQQNGNHFTQNAPYEIISCSCSCPAEYFRHVYWFCSTVCSKIQHIKEQCQILHQALSTAITNVEIKVLSHLSKLQQAKSLIHGKFDNVFNLGEHGMGICSNIQVIRAPAIQLFRPCQLDQDQKRPVNAPSSQFSNRSSNKSTINESSPLFPSVQGQLVFSHSLPVSDHDNCTSKKSNKNNNSKTKQLSSSSSDQKSLSKPINKLKKSASAILKKVLQQKKTNSVSPIVQQDPVASSSSPITPEQRTLRSYLDTALSIINNQEINSSLVTSSQPSVSIPATNHKTNVTVTNLQDLTNVTTRQSSSTLVNKHAVGQAPCQQDFNFIASDQDHDTNVNTSSTIDPSEQNSNTDFQHAESSHPDVGTPSSNPASDMTENPVIYTFILPGNDSSQSSSNLRPPTKSVRALISDIETKFLQCSSSHKDPPTAASSKPASPLLRADTNQTISEASASQNISVSASKFYSSCPTPDAELFSSSTRVSSTMHNHMSTIDNTKVASTKSSSSDIPTTTSSTTSMPTSDKVSSHSCTTTVVTKQGHSIDSVFASTCNSLSNKPPSVNTACIKPLSAQPSQQPIACTNFSQNERLVPNDHKFIEESSPMTSPNQLDLYSHMTILGDVDFLELDSILHDPSINMMSTPSSGDTTKDQEDVNPNWAFHVQPPREPPTTCSGNVNTTSMMHLEEKTHGKTQSNFTILDQIFRPDLPTVNVNITEELQDISTNPLMSSTNIYDMSTVLYEMSTVTNDRLVDTGSTSSNNFHPALKDIASLAHADSSCIPAPVTENNSKILSVSLVSNNDRLQNGRLQEQHPPKSHDKPSSPVTTRQSARKRLFNATPHFKKPDTSIIDDILPLDDQPSASKHRRTCVQHEADDRVSASTLVPMDQCTPCSPSTIAGYISEKYHGKKITNSYPAKNSRSIMQRLLKVLPLVPTGRVTDEKLNHLVLRANDIHEYDLQWYNHVTKTISSSVLESSNQHQPHLFARDLVWHIFDLSDIYQCLISSQPLAEVLDHDIISAIRSATFEKFNIDDKTWDKKCIKQIKHSINHIFYKRLRLPVFLRLLENKLYI